MDGSDSSMRAAAYAGGMARRQRARIVAVYVRPLAPRWPTTAVAVAGYEQASGELAEQLIAEIRAGARRLGFHNWEFRVERGDPYTEICRIADELRADGVYVGSSTQAQRRVVGTALGASSLTLRLVRTGRWPVTVVP
ncbi:universal stress protein [Mangrovactinospora gilvigrisea]|nr:universal stress protein [Mangrovactinospora gilvigrisea]